MGKGDKKVVAPVSSGDGPFTVAIVVKDKNLNPISGASVGLNDRCGTSNSDGYCPFNGITAGTYTVSVTAKGFKPYTGPYSLSGNTDIPVGLESAVIPLPAPPSRDEQIGVNITFQGLVVPTKQYGTLPGFEACLPWLTAEDRAIYYSKKHEMKDTHAIVTIPDGPPLYDEPNQAYSPDKFGPLDWTEGNTVIDSKFTGLIRELINNGFNSILLYLGGDGPENVDIAMKQLDLLYANDDYRTILYKYCSVIPGWDGVFYGWTPEQIIAWGLKFRNLFPDGYAALHYSTGHIPVGEGGDDYKPRGSNPYSNPGRMADFDHLIGEFSNDLHQDSTWQILNRMEENYIRPSDQPSGDDPDRRYYLSTPNLRGPWGHCTMEFGEYEAVRCGDDFDGMVKVVNANRAYLKSMGVKHTG